MRRFLRLWPLLVVTTIITISVYFNNFVHGLYYPTHENISWRTFFLNISFLSATGIVDTEMLNNPAWSISVEFWLSAVVLIWIFRLPAIAILLVSCAFYAVIFSGGDGLMVEAKQFGFTTFGMLRGVAGMSAGVFLYKKKSILEEIMRSIPNRLVDILLFSLMALIIAMMWKSSGSAMDLIAVILIIPFFATGYFQNNTSHCINIFSSSMFVWLGKISFSLYLIHTAVIIQLLPGTYVAYFSKHGAFIITLFVSIVFASVLYYMFEKPVDKIIKNKFIGKYKKN